MTSPGNRKSSNPADNLVTFHVQINGETEEQGYSSEVERLLCTEEAQTPGPKPNKQAKPDIFPLLSRFV